MMTVFTDFFPFAELWYNVVIGMGFLEWLPAIIGGASWLGGQLFGEKPQAPQRGAPQYQINMDWLKDYQAQSESAIQGQTTDWLEKAMRGYRREGSGRGWGLGTSSGYTEFGDRASDTASQNMSTALANLYGQIGGYKTQAQMAGMGQYGADYQAWLQSMQQGQQNWISGLMSVLGMMPGQTPTG